MKFSCHSCGAKYQIADEKLGRKGVKVRCKKCGAMVVVRPEMEPPEEATEVGIKGPEIDVFDDGPSESLPSAEGLLPKDEDEDIQDPNDELSFSEGGLELAGLQDSLRAELSGGLDLEAPSRPESAGGADPAADLEQPAVPVSGSAAPDAPEEEQPVHFEPAPGLSPSLSADLPAGLQAGGPPVVTGTPAEPSQAPEAPVPGPTVEPTTSYPVSSSSVPLSGATEAAALGSTLPDEAAIESELGTAFAAMFSPEGMASDRSPEPAPPEPEPALTANGAEPEPDDAGWFVAIREEQVGPLSFEQLQTYWVQREVGPESLCWKQGMPDWMPVRTVADLAELPDWEQRLEESVPASSDDLSYEGVPTFSAPEVPSEPSVSEFSWRPSAASALDTLAAEEMAQAPASASTGASPFASLPPLDQLPGQGQASPAEGQASPAVPIAATGPATGQALAGAPAAAGPAAAAAAGQAGPGGSPVPAAAGPVGFSTAAAAAGPAVPSAMLPASGVAPVLPAEVKPRKSPVAMALFAGMVVIAAAIGGGFYYLSTTGALGGKGGSASGAGAGGQPVAAADDPGAMPALAASADAGPEDAGDQGSNDGGATADAGVQPPDSGPVDGGQTAVAEAEPEPDPEPKRTRRRRTRRSRPRRTAPERTAPARRPSSDDDLLPPSRSTADALPRTLDESDAYTVLRKHAGEVRGCLDKQRSADPNVKGTMQVKMMIAGSGKPVRVSVSPSRFREAIVGQCVVGSARGWRFPKFSGPAVPLDFPIVVK